MKLILYENIIYIKNILWLCYIFLLIIEQNIGTYNYNLFIFVKKFQDSWKLNNIRTIFKARNLMRSEFNNLIKKGLPEVEFKVFHRKMLPFSVKYHYIILFFSDLNGYSRWEVY